MIDICMALDQSVSPHTRVRTIQNTGVFWQAVFQPPRPYSLSLEHGLRRQNFHLAPTQYRQLRRLARREFLQKIYLSINLPWISTLFMIDSADKGTVLLSYLRFE